METRNPWHPAPADTTAFTCPVCDATSHHPEDARHGYCGACHDFTAPPVGAR